MSVKKATGRLSLPSHLAFVRESKKIDRAIGIEAETSSALGDWEHGTEPTTLATYRNAKDFHQVEYAMAWKGLLADQQAVIPFMAGKSGPDAIWQFELPLKTHQARKLLSSAGIEHRTLLPSADKTKVIVFDPGTKLKNQISKIGASHGIEIQQVKGSGKILGSDSRESAIEQYKSVIDAYEKRFPNRRHYRPVRRSRLWNWRRKTSEEKIPEGHSLTLHDGTVIQLSISDPPDRDRATSQPAKAKDAAAAAAPAISAEVRRVDDLDAPNCSTGGCSPRPEAP